NVSKSFEGLTSWRFHFEFEKGCRPIEVENMWLSGIPNSQTRRCDGRDRDTNHYQPDEQPDASHSAPVECDKDGPWSDDARDYQRNGNGKVSGFTFPRWDMKSGRQGRAKCEAEKQSRGNADDSSQSSEKNRTNGDLIYGGLHTGIIANSSAPAV